MDDDFSGRQPSAQANSVDPAGAAPTAADVAYDDAHFQMLLHAARSQPEPQRLLFVFASAVLPDDATADQRTRFAAGEGGELAPVLCVDKDPQALTTFASLVAESRATGQSWHVMFAVGLSGHGRHAPTPIETGHALDSMVENIRQGRLGRYAAYDAVGAPLAFH